MGNQNNIKKKYNKKDETDLILKNFVDIRIKSKFRRNKINYKLICWLILTTILTIIFISFLIIYFFIQKHIIKYNILKYPKNNENKRIIKKKFSKSSTNDSINIIKYNNPSNSNTKTNKSFINYFQSDIKLSIERGKKYFELCMNNTLINKNAFTKNEKPFISVVIPVFNIGERLLSSVMSVRNQNVTNIEIILVNDSCNNKTSIVMKKLKDEDPRIVIINNKKNMGTLYSRCIGALSSKGRYIFPLDDDDLFFDEDVLYIVSKIAKDGNFDIVEFKGAERYQFNVFTNNFRDSEYSNHANNLVLHQPELGQYARRKNNIFGIYDVFLWAKCIENEVYKKTINAMGEDIYNNKIIWGEDLITSFILFRIAKSFLFINKYGISRFKSMSTEPNHTPLQTHFLSLILYIQILLKFTQNNFYDKQLLVHETLSFIRIRKFLNEKNKNILRNVLIKILENAYITNIDKDRIKFYGRYYLNETYKL